jgi:hypothetical protein
MDIDTWVDKEACLPKCRLVSAPDGVKKGTTRWNSALVLQQKEAIRSSKLWKR